MTCAHDAWELNGGSRRCADCGKSLSCRLRPGSLTEDGAVIDADGRTHNLGPCFVPRFCGATTPSHRNGRAMALDAAGWRWLRDATRWPGIPRNSDDMCIIRISM